MHVILQQLQTWQYKLSLPYLKEQLKLYINFVYNYSVSCSGLVGLLNN
jgi:hypothetical protein